METTITAATRALLILRRRWPRRLIVGALADHPDPRESLLSGSLAQELSARFAGTDADADATFEQSNKVPEPVAHDGALGLLDEAFPALLRHIPDPPLLLFYRGNIALLKRPGVAVVGARRCTAQGRSNAQALARDLAAAGLTVVSGMALGIDGAAHGGALNAVRQLNDPNAVVPTIAVLGGGLARLYPRRHNKLAQTIVEAGGLVVSEYEDGMPPLAHQFPERNRVISGLSLATVVVEATTRSGSLITARLAAEQGRDVFAMPGPVSNAVSEGCHRLIQQGAGLVRNAEDVLLALGIEGTVLASHLELPDNSAQADVPLDDDTKNLLNLIQGYPLSLDELLLQTDHSIEHLTNMLVTLELGGFVQQGPLGYSRAP